MKKALHSFLLMCLITAQLFLPMKAYAIAPALVWAFGASVGLHAGALLFKLDDVQPPAAAGATGGGGVSFKLDGKPTVTPQGWPNPTTPPAVGTSTPVKTTWIAVCSTLTYWPNGNCMTFRSGNVSERDNAHKIVCQRAGNQYSGGGCYSMNWNPRSNSEQNLGEVERLACQSGYVQTYAGGCDLADATKVRKPEGTECEFVYKAGKFVPDPQNPACDGKATNTISRTGCDLTTSEQKMFMNCPATNSTVEMTPTQLTATSDEGTFTVPATVDETGAYTVSVPTNVQNIKGFDDRDLQNLSSFTNKITVDFYGSTNKTEWGCIGGTGACSHVSVDPAGSGGSSTNTSSGGSTGGTGGTTGGSTGGTTGGTTGDGSGTGTGTGDASGSLAGIGDIEGWIDGAVGKIKSFFSGGADDAAPSSTPTPKTDVPLQLKSGDSYMSAGACPAPAQIPISFYGVTETIEIPYTIICEFAITMKPIFSVISYLSAAYIIFRRD